MTPDFPAASISEIFAMLSGYNALIEDYQPIDREAIWLTPADGTKAAELEATILAPLTECGWIVTSLKGGKVLIEPKQTRPIGIEPPGCVFHVSPKSNRAMIQEDGLIVKTGGNTRMERKYPARIYFALDLLAAFEFADFQCRVTMNPMKPRDVIQIVDEQELQKLDVWRVRTPEPLLLRRDVLFPRRAGWTDQSVRPEHLSLVEYWRAARKLWHLLRKIGAV